MKSLAIDTKYIFIAFDPLTTIPNDWLENFDFKREHLFVCVFRKREIMFRLSN